jgi:hypothetical protein
MLGWINFGMRGHDRALELADMSAQSESGDMSPHSKLICNFAHWPSGDCFVRFSAS